MKTPIIGITVSRAQKNHQLYNQNPSAYSDAILQAGGLPLLIPVEYPITQIDILLDHIDGLLLSGGGDLDYRRYAGNAHLSIEGVCEERDELEIELLKGAIQKKMPVLGICRGTQLINVALGGSLYADIPTQYETHIIHSTPEEKGRNSLVHEVELNPNSKLGKIIGQTRFSVNSFHHQAIRVVAPELVVTAYATDGLIEAVELAGDPFGVIGVQWHPECLLNHPSQLEIFKAFLSACK
jgi:putative glutamine amidotransferase